MKHSAKTLLLSGAAALLIAGMAVTPSMSYFTTYVEARGSKELRIEEIIPEFDEQYESGIKTITVHNKGEGPCYVRLKAFAGSEITLAYAGDGWTQESDGYYYYSAVLQPGEDAAPLMITITHGETLDHSYNVTVVQEAAPIFYNADGTVAENNAGYVGWNLEGRIVHIEETFDKNGKVDEQP